MKKNRKMLVLSLIMILGLLISFAGVTFAWFSDSVSSNNNIITAGNLDVEVEYKDADGQWQLLKETSNVFEEDAKWEPGHTEVVYLRISNNGSLSLRYTLDVNIVSEIGSKNVYGEDFLLSNYIRFGAVEGEGVVFATRQAALEGVKDANDLISSNYHKQGVIYAAEDAEYIAMVVYMPDSVGNEANHHPNAVAPEIKLGINVSATQANGEEDSFGNDYDDFEWPALAPGESFSATTNVTPDSNGKVPSTTTVGDDEGDIYAVVPQGVQLADGANMLKLTVNAMTETESNVTAANRSEVVRSVDVHIDGVAEDNTVPMIITLNGILPLGLNSSNVKLFHVEDGVTYEMTLVDSPVNHNEFSYDPATGNAVIAIASFSEIVVYGDTAVKWNGTVATSFAGGTGTEADPYIIANGEQLAYFRNLVDGGKTFAGEYVKLNANINLNDINFDPIGWGYEYDGFTEGGKTFNGTFDGNGKIIFGLYQNGWDANDCGKTYDYSMAGGGLFASVCDATIKNLTISGADIVMECIDMGVVVGYAQGNCTFDNIAIINCTIQNYNRYTGGVVGECSPRYDESGTPLYSNHLFNNIRVDSTTIVSSLWGSFDTSLGGILGGKWDKNGAQTKVTMTNCEVACKIDAFNDVTSAYQWYAYRRAGMLIGNTEESADHKALATFLTCENVHVYYGEWNNYHYCEFENQSGTEDAAWQNNYPWVRVESGLSCGAYSNPRYGHPIVNGVAIADSIHGHAEGDECMVSIPFKQLYGGDQGVYGATEHEGVSEGAYTVTYISYGETVRVEFVADNTKVHTLWDCKNLVVGDSKPLYWENGHGEKVESIHEGHATNYIVYPKWPEEFTIRFHDAEGNMLYHEHFKEGSDHQLNMDEVNAALEALQTKIDATKRVIIVSWDTDLSKLNLKGATGDITVHAVYNLSTSSVTLEPVYDSEGILTHYKVVDAAESIENVIISIPPRVGTVPVAQLGAGAFAGFDNLHAVVIPKYITHIGQDAIAENWKNGTFGNDKGETITIYYEGTYAEWQSIKLDNGWSNGLSKDSRIFFLKDGKVDYSQGYLQFVVDDSNWLGAVKKGHFEHKTEIPSSFADEYVKVCDCKIDNCHGKIRPDAKYWQ